MPHPVSVPKNRRLHARALSQHSVCHAVGCMTGKRSPACSNLWSWRAVWQGCTQHAPQHRFLWLGCVRALSENDKEEIKPVDFFLFDVTGGVFEYQITKPMGPNTTHSKARSALAAALKLWSAMCLAVPVSCSVAGRKCWVMRMPAKQEP